LGFAQQTSQVFFPAVALDPTFWSVLEEDSLVSRLDGYTAAAEEHKHLSTANTQSKHLLYTHNGHLLHPSTLLFATAFSGLSTAAQERAAWSSSRSKHLHLD